MDEHPGARCRRPLRARLTTASMPLVVADDEVPELIRVAAMDRLGGLLNAAIEVGTVSISDPARHQVRELWHEQLVVSVMVEALAVRTADLLDAAGVTWRLTKGPALAHLDDPDPSLRPFGDVDIVVHPSSWVAARSTRSPAPDASVSSPSSVPALISVSARARRSPHRTGSRSTCTDGWRSGASECASPRTRCSPGVDHVTLAGRSVPTLDGPARPLHACYHAALGGFRHLRAHRDVAQLLMVSDVAWEETVEIVPNTECRPSSHGRSTTCGTRSDWTSITRPTIGRLASASPGETPGRWQCLPPNAPFGSRLSPWCRFSSVEGPPVTCSPSLDTRVARVRDRSVKQSGEGFARSCPAAPGV